MAEEKRTITPEELAKRKAEIEKFHLEQIPFLEQQLKYENLLTDIEDSRARRAMAMMRFAQIMAGPQQENMDDPKDPKPEVTQTDMVQPEEGALKEPVFRTLKKDKE